MLYLRLFKLIALPCFLWIAWKAGQSDMPFLHIFALVVSGLLLRSFIECVVEVANKQLEKRGKKMRWYGYFVAYILLIPPMIYVIVNTWQEEQYLSSACLAAIFVIVTWLIIFQWLERRKNRQEKK